MDISDAFCAAKLRLFLNTVGVLADWGDYLPLMRGVLGAAEHKI